MTDSQTLRARCCLALLVTAGALLGGAACGRSGTNNYGAAAGSLGGTVLGTGLYRAATGGCWANCAKDYYCNRQSGLCERGECDPRCRDDQACVREANGVFRCVASGASFTPRSPDAGAPE